jgi:HK97 family phage major capsid protein
LRGNHDRAIPRSAPRAARRNPSRSQPATQSARRLLSRASADDALGDPGIIEKANRLSRGIENAEAAAEQAGQALLNDHVADPTTYREAGVEYPPARRVEDEYGETTVLPNARGNREGALRTIERHVKDGTLTSAAADRVDSVLRGPDAPLGLDARYIEAAGSPHYATAFHKAMRFGEGAGMHMTREEMAAWQKTNEIEQTRTALTVGSGAGGGFAIPIAVDPSINLSSNGALNPIRQLAEVRSMSTRELRLVTSDGVVAQYQAEAAEAVDNSPVLAQPTLIAQRATSFVPFSFEVDQDWSSVAAELTQLVSDAKDVLESTKFLLGAGSGSNEPVGILTIGTTGALTTTQRVLSAGAGAVAIGDVYALKQALGQTRFATSATWAMNPTRLDAVFRLTPSGSTTEPQIMTDRNGALLGRPTAEWSTMATAVTTGSKWALYGDFKRGYVIGDRLGMSFEIIPHLFGSGSRFPTGQRGAYAIWRNDGKCKVLNALRYGETS